MDPSEAKGRVVHRWPDRALPTGPDDMGSLEVSTSIGSDGGQALSIARLLPNGIDSLAAAVRCVQAGLLTDHHCQY